MSRYRAIRALKFQSTDMIPSMEFTTGLSAQNLLAITSIDPKTDYYGSLLRLIDTMEIDIHGPLPLEQNIQIKVEQNPVPNKPHQAEWGLTKGSQVKDGAQRNLSFYGPEDVLNFEPLQWNQQTEDGLLSEFSLFHRRNLNLFGHRCVAEEDIYTTLFHWCIDTFGWENFMLAASMSPARFEEIMLQFKELSIRRTRAWAQVDNLDFFMCHDDICMTRGPVFRPDWYRQYVFPHYADIWAPLKEKKVPVIFISDGNYFDLADDITACDPDGFVFDHSVDFAAMMKKFGGKKILIGGPDIRILSFKTPAEIESHLMNIFEVARGVPGYFYCTAGSLTENIPYENLKKYIELSLELRIKFPFK
jgi:hypothetical protein